MSSWLQDTIDDAKKRAITTTASYDEFRSRVAGCMLKPIHKSEFNAPPKFSFNRPLGPLKAFQRPFKGALKAF